MPSPLCNDAAPRQGRDIVMRHPRVLGALVVALSLVCAGAALQDVPHDVSPEVPQPPQGLQATVEQLAFISGDWRLRLGDDLLHEHWSEPAGNCLLGSFRWIKQGESVWMYEFLTMRNEDGGVTMRFRHFDDALNCWEEKDEPLMFRLTELDQQRALFQHFGGDGEPWAMIFHRLDDEALTITVTDASRNEATGQAFAYHRRAASAR